MLALQVHYVRYTLASALYNVVQEVCSRFEFTRHFESHLARPPPFYMRMRTTISDEHQCYTVHVLYSQPIRLSPNSERSATEQRANGDLLFLSLDCPGMASAVVRTHNYCGKQRGFCPLCR